MLCVTAGKIWIKFLQDIYRKGSDVLQVPEIAR